MPETYLVVCPASLCKKWQDELRDRFGVRAEICNAKDLLNKIEQADRYGMKSMQSFQSKTCAPLATPVPTRELAERFN